MDSVSLQDWFGMGGNRFGGPTSVTVELLGRFCI